MPKLRFKREDGTDYPEWTKQKLSAVASRVTRKNKGNITDIPLTIASLYGLVDQREYFKKKIASRNMEGYYLLHNGEFAYNKSYSKGFDFGAIKRLDRYDCGALSTLYICFAVNNKVDSDFMTHYFDSQKWNKEVSIRCAEGARNHGLLNISTNDFFDIDMVLPADLEEQQKIADFLSNVDEVIAQSEAEVANLQQQKKAAMQKIFSQEVRFKREDGTSYPEWTKQKLSAVSSRVTRKNKGNITDIPLTIASLYGLVDQREYFKKKIASRNMEGYYLLHNGEFAYNKSYSKGFDFGAIKRLDRYDCGALSTLYICFAVNNKVDSDFMTHYFDSQKWNKEVSIRCAEGARNHGLLNISTNDFFDIDMVLPTDLEEQQKIADFLATYDEAISCAKQELDKWKELKKGLLQQMFA